jgi:hypothetical protein
MQSVKAGQRMADQSRHGHLERDTEQVDCLNVLMFTVDSHTSRSILVDLVWALFQIFLLPVGVLCACILCLLIALTSSSQECHHHDIGYLCILDMHVLMSQP